MEHIQGKRIAQIITEFSPFGAERVAYGIARSVARSGRPASVIAVREFSDAEVSLKIREELEAEGVNTLCLNRTPSKSTLGTCVAAAKQLHLLLGKSRFGLLHSHTDIPDFVLALGALGRTCLRMRTLHNTVLWPGRSTVASVVERLLNPTVEIAVSHEVYDSWPDYLARLHIKRNSPPVLIENSFSTDGDTFFDRHHARRRLAIGGDELSLLFLGRLVEQKGFDKLLGAAKSDDWPDRAILYVIGSGELQKLIQDADPRRVKYLGFRPDGYRYMKAFDALVLPSRHEGAPMVIQEALAAGLYSLVSRAVNMPMRVSGDRYQIIDVDSAEALARSIAEWTSSASLCVTTESGSDHNPTHGVEMSVQYIEIYSSFGL